jgi:hypothetical protein
MARFRVNALAREGLPYRHRAGEAWPRGEGSFRDVLVVDTENDPPGRTVDGEFAIGQSSYRTSRVWGSSLAVPLLRRRVR